MNIKETSKKYEEYILNMRRTVHANPEVSGKEYETSKLIQAELDKMGVPYVQCGLETGVLATIKGGKPGKTILIRGDMDALTVNEENDLPFKSRNEGVMHACGHDCHTAMMLTAAQILNDIKDELCGTVKLAFQPAEEIAVGAKAMIENGAMEGVDAVFAIHVWSKVPSGKVAVQAGPRMASADMFEIWVQGKGGHGAEPASCIDAITCTTAIVNSLQTIVSREYRPLDAAVCTVGRIDAGTRWNVIADSAYISGTTRCFDSQIYDEFPGRIERIAKGIGDAYRCGIQFKNTPLVPPTLNHPEISALAMNAAETIFGEGANYPFDATTGGEDFAYFVNAAPDKKGAVAFLGIGCDECDSWWDNHSPKFKVDESALLGGACLYCQVVADFLNN